MAFENSALVSVVVPVYDSEKLVAQCIESIIMQTYHNLEIILINDGSTDNSGEICDHFSRQDRRIRVIHQENAGLASVRKIGVQIATGQYLCFVDGDDWIGPEYVSHMYQLMASSSADLVISGHVREFMGRLQLVPPRLPTGVYDRHAILNRILPQALFNGNFFQHGVSTYVWNKMFKRGLAASVMREIPGSIVMGEDACLTYPYLISCQRVAVTAEFDYFYRQRRGSIVKSVESLETEYRRLSALAQFLTEQFQKAPVSARLDEQLRQYFYSLVLTRTGGVIYPSSRGAWFTPFPGLSVGSRVVVCSSGAFGQHLVSALRRIDGVDVVGWIDEDDQESQRIGLPVSPLESAAVMDFDLLLVASLDPEYTEAISFALAEIGIDMSRIAQVRPDLGRLEELLIDVGFDTTTYTYCQQNSQEPHHYE